jgi:hypothetical protein
MVKTHTRTKRKASHRTTTRPDSKGVKTYPTLEKAQSAAKEDGRKHTIEPAKKNKRFKIVFQD